jgi:hypothetical protein
VVSCRGRCQQLGEQSDARSNQHGKCWGGAQRQLPITQPSVLQHRVGDADGRSVLSTDSPSCTVEKALQPPAFSRSLLHHCDPPESLHLYVVRSRLLSSQAAAHHSNLWMAT